ncbi:uncharacterized protein LOC129291209 isoform X2 [Prosopis cineraria]|uniref:uncharacterized protein LOC129291209 isoform X2 n=1 Tax=Prosopis cineraria TaxID=364024 RepID=UPI00240EA6FD|nr:uncharacterized protein LOC129291209 isoform X2 [Prosopis cineraria]XP_054784438.1 uncharacterized protein LOC129291209 isoform X2 [Prosopis cineraria]
MGEKKQLGSSSSSLTCELFGSKESYPSPSSGIFGSIFSPSSKVLGGESLLSELNGKTPSGSLSSEIGTRDVISRMNDNETQCRANKEMSSIYQEQRVQPCHLSSSIFYGGQDVYYHPQNTENAGLNSLNKKDGGEDDSGIASRGNWWQGSLYY